MKYLSFGDSKKVLVFLHGWGLSKEAFLWTKDYFDDYRKIYVDFAGFGESPEPDKVFCLSDYLTELKSLLDGFEIDKLVLVGHSFGGRVAVKFAYLYQNEYRDFKLCLVDSAGIRPRLSIAKRYKIWKYKRLNRKVDLSDDDRQKLKTMGSSDYQKLSDIMKGTFIKIVNEDLLPILKFVECDVCLIWGQKDKETKLWMARKMLRAFKNSELYIFKNCGHFAYADKPREFLIILDTFIKNK